MLKFLSETLVGSLEPSSVCEQADLLRPPTGWYFARNRQFILPFVISSLGGIDWRSFLGRPPMPAPSAEALGTIAQERILITGAGGSIGSALALRLARLAPRELLLLECSESGLFALQNRLRKVAPNCPPKLVLGSVLDRILLEETFDLHQPTLVFHAAAYKQVPLLEEHPFASIETNVCGTDTLAQASAQSKARLILLSTDKAVEPASVMGATKRVAELIVLESGGTVLRLGNVLASSGSVAEVFAAQIDGGGPLAVTDPAARRYFLTVEEAVDLLLSASMEPGHAQVFIPTLPTQHFVADLARFMARALAPDRKINIEFTESRPGDKESERLFGSDERTEAVHASGLQSLFSPRTDAHTLRRTLSHLRGSLGARDLASALADLHSLVPDYAPSATLRLLVEQKTSRATT